MFVPRGNLIQTVCFQSQVNNHRIPYLSSLIAEGMQAVYVNRAVSSTICRVFGYNRTDNEADLDYFSLKYF